MIDENERRLLCAELTKPLYALKYRAIKEGFLAHGPKSKAYFAGYARGLEDYKKELDRLMPKETENKHL